MKRSFDIAAFQDTLIEQGAVILEPTSEWEVLRYKLDGKIGIVYRNKKGHHSFNELAGKQHTNWMDGRDVQTSKKQELQKGWLWLYTDASSYHATQAGAWAGILVLPNGSEHEAHGPLRGEIGSSTMAEACAVANSLHTFGKAGLIPQRSIVRVVCDNQPVIKYVNGKKARSADVKRACATIFELKKKLGITLHGEWVKGHQPAYRAKSDPRVEYNRRCDSLATRHGRALNQERRQPCPATM